MMKTAEELHAQKTWTEFQMKKPRNNEIKIWVRVPYEAPEALVEKLASMIELLKNYTRTNQDLIPFHQV